MVKLSKTRWRARANLSEPRGILGHRQQPVGQRACIFAGHEPAVLARLNNLYKGTFLGCNNRSTAASSPTRPCVLS